MAPTDSRSRLATNPFSFRSTKDGDVHIMRDGKLITILRGQAAQKFLSRVSVLDPIATQHLLARVTGQYKHGNESRHAG